MPRKAEKVAVAPGRAALPRKKREVPAHVKAAADRAEARATGKEPKARPAKKEAPATRLDKEDEDERAHRIADRVVAAAMADIEERGVGRPAGTGEYKAEYVDIVRAMVGAVTDFDVAQELGVTTRTIYRWKRIHTDFCQAVTDKKEHFDDAVEHSLATRATGYYYEDVHMSSFQGIVKATPIVKHMPADVSAAKQWLANRRPDKWKDVERPPEKPVLSIDEANVIAVARTIMFAMESAKKVLTSKVITGEAQVVDADG